MKNSTVAVPVVGFVASKLAANYVESEMSYLISNKIPVCS